MDRSGPSAKQRRPFLQFSNALEKVPFSQTPRTIRGAFLVLNLNSEARAGQGGHPFFSQTPRCKGNKEAITYYVSRLSHLVTLMLVQTKRCCRRLPALYPLSRSERAHIADQRCHNILILQEHLGGKRSEWSLTKDNIHGKTVPPWSLTKAFLPFWRQNTVISISYLISLVKLHTWCTLLGCVELG
jgi:hypothetical protein